MHKIDLSIGEDMMFYTVDDLKAHRIDMTQTPPAGTVWPYQYDANTDTIHWLWIKEEHFATGATKTWPDLIVSPVLYNGTLYTERTTIRKFNSERNIVHA